MQARAPSASAAGAKLTESERRASQPPRPTCWTYLGRSLAPACIVAAVLKDTQISFSHISQAENRIPINPSAPLLTYAPCEQIGERPQALEIVMGKRTMCTASRTNGQSMPSPNAILATTTTPVCAINSRSTAARSSRSPWYEIKTMSRQPLSESALVTSFYVLRTGSMSFLLFTSITTLPCIDVAHARL